MSMPEIILFNINSRQVYTVTAKPSQNSGSRGSNDANKTLGETLDWIQLNCTLDFFEEILLKALNSSDVKFDVLNEQLASCNETDSSEAQDK